MWTRNKETCCSAWRNLGIYSKNYNISPTELRNANNDMEIFYTGLEINIPIKKPTVVSNRTELSPNSDEQFLKTLTAYMNDCEIADKLFEARNYSKAQKQYQQIIRKYNGVLSCEEALYGNALCSYNREKWKSAIKDLSIVVNNEDCSQEQRNHCKKLLVKAQSYRDQQLENRNNLWGGLFMTAATVGVAYMNAKSGSKPTSGTLTSNTSTISDSNDSSTDNGGSSEQTFKKSSKVCRRCNGGGKCFRVTEKVSEQTITLVLALTPHTIVAYVEVTANVPLAMEQGSKANCFEILYVWQIDY